MSETETRLSQNAVDSETRPSKSGLKTGLKTETNLEYYNTTTKNSLEMNVAHTVLITMQTYY